MKTSLPLILLLILLQTPLFSQIERIEPPFWWVEMEIPKVQVMVSGPEISTYQVKMEAPGFNLERVIHTTSPNYVFLDISIASSAQPGAVEIAFFKNQEKAFSQSYEFRQRAFDLNHHKGFGSEDVIYLIMPDRFANGDPNNDTVEGMIQKADRSLNDARHGGDLKGIIERLDYVEELGVTAIWLNPVLENDNDKYSYHGYSPSDHYEVDRRFGTNEDFLAFADGCRERGMKVIMDVVLNHCSNRHPLVEDLPFPGWVNQWPAFTRTNYHVPVITDPHTSEYDIEKMLTGWFDTYMADLNTQHAMVNTYLIQNTIWWIEYAGIDGIRLDTQPYADKEMVAQWGEAIMKEYPNFNIVGEAWGLKASRVAYWQADADNYDGYNSHLRSVMDFPLNLALKKALTEPEGWGRGIIQLYDALGEDFLYAHPNDLVVFADNHDMTRFFTTVEKEMASFKMGMAFVLTTRGIPNIYYGTEILMTGKEEDGHGHIRTDFPGGWKGDDRNAFKKKGRTKEEQEAFSFIQKLLQWRKGKPVIHHGNLIHFRPENGVYVFFRSDEQETVMVAFNVGEESQNLGLNRFAECIRDHTLATDILSGEEITDLRALKLEPRSVRILELK